MKQSILMMCIKCFLKRHFSNKLVETAYWSFHTFQVLTNTSLFPPSVFLFCGWAISSVTSGLWQGGLVMATHSCNMDGAFHISVVNKGNRSRSFSISTSHDLPTSWQRGEERERAGLTMFSNGCFLTVWQWPEHCFGQAYHSIFIHWESVREFESYCGNTEKKSGRFEDANI